MDEHSSQPWRHTALTIPNIITMIRIMLTPLFIIMVLQKRYAPALAIFILAGISDLVDGLIARHWQQKSPLGAYLDPIADKLLLSSSFLALGYFQILPAWLAVVVISRDVLIVGGIIGLKVFDQPVQIRPTQVSKWATAMQILAIFAALAKEVWPVPGLLIRGCFWITAMLTVYSGAQYLLRGLEILNRNSTPRS